MSWWDAHCLCERQPENESASPRLEHPRRGDLPAPVDWGDDGRLRPQSKPPLQTQMFPDDKTPRSWGGKLTQRTPFSFLWNATFPLIPHCCSFIAAPRHAQTTAPPYWLAQQIDTVGSQSERDNLTRALFLNAEILLGGPVQVIRDGLVETKTNTEVHLITMLLSSKGEGGWFRINNKIGKTKLSNLE